MGREFVRPCPQGGFRLLVWVQPGARRSEFAGTYQGSLKIRLAAPAVDNKANKALVDFVAEALGLKKNRVALESGHASRRKTLRIEDNSEPDWDSLIPRVETE